MVTFCIISPTFQSDHHFFDNLDNALDVYSPYEKVLITGDFNAQGEKVLNAFLYQHELKSLNKETTFHRNPNKPNCIDIILTNSPRSFSIQKLISLGYQIHKLVVDFLIQDLKK